MPALTAMPYSEKGLRALADMLRIHSSLMWIDPITNQVSVKKLPEILRRQLGHFEKKSGSSIVT
ncbi:MAG: hypothetical protein COU65_02830 [Candidatus Pacebacteria bacterium CG10_big_fil_rev_8_21_14_0_10_42_12]|nr:MAG: hypothetical protein COU65_02830 [Candidatus Pacebacteria bacterium CG10_big_fil_rev_8_21_14_0_10_42_12]